MDSNTEYKNPSCYMGYHFCSPSAKCRDCERLELRETRDKLTSANLQNDELRAALKTIYEMFKNDSEPDPGVSTMLGIIKETLAIKREGESMFPTTEQLKVYREVDKFFGACEAHRMADCRTCKEK